MNAPWCDGDEQILAQLYRHGDTGIEPRPVIHFVYFADASSAEAFGSAAAASYAVRVTRQDEAERAYRFVVRLERVAPVVRESLAPTIGWLHELATEHQGRYDGWECEVRERWPAVRATCTLPEEGRAVRAIGFVLRYATVTRERRGYRMEIRAEEADMLARPRSRAWAGA